MNKLILNFKSKDTKKIKNSKNLLGGKGANLSEMGRMGLPVPPGFTISTKVCEIFYKKIYYSIDETLFKYKFKLEIKTVVKPIDQNDEFNVSNEAYTGPGIIINSNFLTPLNKIWYQFNGTRWVKTESGIALKQRLSHEVYQIILDNI